MSDNPEATFDRLLAALLLELKPGEQFTLKLSHEESQFIRFNRARVRQTGIVTDGRLSLTLIKDDRSSFQDFPFTADWETDWQQVQTALEQLRWEIPQLPVDPYLVLPAGNHHSHEVHQGKLLAADEVVPVLLAIVADLDFTGIYAGGRLIRAYADSAGQKHWFVTDSYSLDYSLFTETGQAVKGVLAGSDWDTAACEAKLGQSKTQIALLSRPVKNLPRGSYQTYLAPAALEEIMGLLNWGSLSEAALQQGSSALGALYRGEKQLSSAFNLKENFGRGLVPRFNDLGEMAPVELSLISEGQLKNTLVSSRTAKEYDKTANGATTWEALRSPEISPGNLSFSQILPTLDRGLYVSNLHYLNWSDRPTGRITGMTRYACFWVEQGEIVAPIANLRFDESLYRFWGQNLVALTNFQEFIPDVSTYGGRELGGMWVPGMIVADFTYTL